MTFDITRQEAWGVFLMQGRKCTLSGVDLSFGNGVGDATASLDRIDSTRGYTSDNIQWVHKQVNRMKMDVPEHELIEWCRKIVACSGHRIT